MIQARTQHKRREARVRTALSKVMDPEIPALNVLEMGIVRHIEVESNQVKVTITPTYSGCPAMDMISREIRRAMQHIGFAEVRIEMIYAPPWTSDWLTPEARQKLIESGIAPPPPVGSPEDTPLACPYCNSLTTELRSFFGCTACKALHFCKACQQPFESFKAI